VAYEFSCRDVDHICGWKGEASSEEELLTKLAQHVQQDHEVKTVTDTIVNFAKLKIRRV
jgi:predicted small metal-binding protein